MEEGLTAVSAAVQTPEGRSLAAMSVAGAISRLTRVRCDDVIPALLETVQQLARCVTP